MAVRFENIQRWILLVLGLMVLGIQHDALAQRLFDSANANSAKQKLELIRITPNGDGVNPSNRQLVFKFNQPMTAVGLHQVDAQDVPIKISPAVDCEWRWLDTSSLSCQLGRDAPLKLATRYRVDVANQFKALSGVKLDQSIEHSFTTQRPKVERVRLEDWSTLDKPVVRLSFNQPVTRDSVLQAMRFRTQDGRFTSSVLIPEFWNPLTDRLFLKHDDTFRSFPYLSSSLDEAEKRREIAIRSKAQEQARTVWRIQPSLPLPQDTRIELGSGTELSGIEGPLGSLAVKVHHGFTSLPAFKFIGLECRLAPQQSELFLKPDYRSSDKLRTLSKDGSSALEKTSACDPQQAIGLRFSVPVSYQTAKGALSFTPDLSGGDPTYDPWSTRVDDYAISSFYARRFNYDYVGPYSLRVPEFLKAYEQYSIISNNKLKDEFERVLDSAIDMAFLTAHRQPNLVFMHPHSVFESTVDSELGAYVTNLETLKVSDYRVVTAGRNAEGPFSYSKDLPFAQDVAYRERVGVRKMLDGQSGAVFGELSSVPLVQQYGYEVTPEFFSQVTPFHVHLKLGHFNSYAWITDMATGLPVADALVAIEFDSYNELSLANSKERVSDAKGLVELPGMVELDPELSQQSRYGFDGRRLFVKVKKGDQLAFLPVDSNYATWSQIWPSLRKKDSYLHTWGTTAQGVYKAGDTVQYKLYVRGQNNRHWVGAPKGEYTLKVIDPKGQIVEERANVALNEFGSMAGEFDTHEASSVGWYQFELHFKSNEGIRITRQPMRVLVSDFTPSPFRAANDLNADRFGVGDTIEVESYATLHAGGPYANAQARVTATYIPKRFTSNHPQAKGFRFNANTEGRQSLFNSQEQLDQQGRWRSEFKLKDIGAHFGQISVETAVRDDRGKYVASTSTADYVGRDRFVGLKNTSWIHDVGKAAKVQYLVVDEAGEPVQDQPVSIKVEHRLTTAARVKGAGNAFTTQYNTEWVEVSTCTETSEHRAKSCKFTPNKPGSHRITATLNDTKGRLVNSQIYTWVVGEGALLWDEQNQNRIDIVADKAHYKSGEVAKFLIKNPYPDAQALITVERYGVMRSWQQTLKGSTPVIEVPIKVDDYPGFYLSVVVASARVDKPISDNDVDLGKPGFKMGYLKVDVRDDAKEIDVSVRTNKNTYKPRENVTVSVKATPKTGARQDMELAVVVLDESVLALNAQGTGYYDPYQGFNRLDNLGVANYNLLMRLVGRQKFEKKGANAGGGGGQDQAADLRNLMKFVAYWNPSIKLSKNGKAKIDLELPDNLTGWRVLAMVVDQESRMGLGHSNFKVNRPTELRPVMPNQLTRGDRFNAGFSVMNRTNKRRNLNLELRASGSAIGQPQEQLSTLTLDPFERRTVFMPIVTEATGELAFYASAGDRKDKDAIEHHLNIEPRYVLQSQATYGTSVAEIINEPFAFPKGVVAGEGGVSVTFSPSVIGNITGAFEYLRDYPYACWEQRMSKAVAAAQYQDLQAYTPKDFSWPESDTLAQKTLEQAVQFQAPNGGMTYWVNRNDFVSPYLSAYTAMAFTWLRNQGYQVPADVEEKLHSYLRTYLRGSDQQREVQLSVRAVALAALAQHGSIGLKELIRYEPQFEAMNLFAKAHYLRAAILLGLEEERVISLSKILLNYSVQSGGKFTFQEPTSFQYGSMLHSSMRSNCSILNSMLAVSQHSDAGLQLVGDVPFKLVRSITQTRGQRHYWANTQENVYCMNALRQYGNLYERDTPNMELLARLSDTKAETSSRLNMTNSKGKTALSFTSLRDESKTLSTKQLSENDFRVAAGVAGDVQIEKSGSGRFYYSVRSHFALDDEHAKAVNSGIEIRREYSVQRDGVWVILTAPMRLEQGELVRVDLFVSTNAARNYVVVDDPVPGGLEPVNRDLATSSSVDSQSTSLARPAESWYHELQKEGGSWRNFGPYGYSFYHQELRHNSARFYSDYLPAGDYLLSYTAQAIASGEFAVKPVKVEEMYDPDVFGLGVPASLNVKQFQMPQGTN